jgi:GNAT superfamily N-acetyltransferase
MKMADLIIRPARQSDAPAIVAMLRTIHAQHVAWDAARWTTSEPPHTSYTAWIEDLLERPREGAVFVAEVDDTIAGYTLAEVEPESVRHWSPRAVYVHDLFVAERHRRLGIARALMRSLFDWSATNHPSLQLRLMTAAPNALARDFFASLGFSSCVVEMIRPAGA